MQEVRLSSALWAGRLLPEGLIEKWHVPSGAQVGQGQDIASVRIEGALHEIVSPEPGRLSILLVENSVVEPGSIIATIEGKIGQ